MKALVAIALGVAAFAVSSNEAKAHCGHTSIYNKQVITWTNGGKWTCRSGVNEDIIKWFTKGTVQQYWLDMSGFDNCKVYRAKDDGVFNYWFTADALGDVYPASAIGSQTVGIRLGC